MRKTLNSGAGFSTKSNHPALLSLFAIPISLADIARVIGIANNGIENLKLDREILSRI